MPQWYRDLYWSGYTAWCQAHSPWRFCSDCGRPVSELWKFCVGCRCVLHKLVPPCPLDDTSEADEETTEPTRRPPPDDGHGGGPLKVGGIVLMGPSAVPAGRFADASAATDIRIGTGTARAQSRSPKRDKKWIRRPMPTDSRMN
jgi:hypothetical protein